MVVVAIDDDAYEDHFRAVSPLDRGRLGQLLSTIRDNAVSARRIAVDLDVTPTDPGLRAAPDALDILLLDAPGRWVLPAVPSVRPDARLRQAGWRRALCDAGVRFAHPFVPTEFGYPRLTHQYRDSLAQAMLSADPVCADPSQPLTQLTQPLSPTALKDPLVIPFSGDLDALGAALRAIDPEWVVVGGTWGVADVFSTPFGSRYGVHIHAAALAGALEGQRLVPYWAQLLGAWLFVGLLAALATALLPRIERAMRPASPAMSGHAFFFNVVQPMLFVLAVLAATLLAIDLLAGLRASTAIWIPSALLTTNVVFSLVLTWNWGRSAVRRYEGPADAFLKLVVGPVRADWVSLGTSLRVLVKGPQPGAWQIDPGAGVRVGRAVAAREALLALTSLSLQTGLPLAVLGYGLVLHT